METTVIPFCGLRYNLEQIDDIADVIAPPYDVIKPEERRALEMHHPANIIHLILSQPRDDDTDTTNQYTPRSGTDEPVDFGRKPSYRILLPVIISTTRRSMPQMVNVTHVAPDCPW